MTAHARLSAKRLLCLAVAAGILSLGGALCSARAHHHSPVKGAESRIATVEVPSDDIARFARVEGGIFEPSTRCAATGLPSDVRFARRPASDIGFDPIPIRHRKVPLQTDSAEPPH
jgi:hypothetical protein